jgi:hypothetical protein
MLVLLIALLVAAAVWAGDLVMNSINDALRRCGKVASVLPLAAHTGPGVNGCRRVHFQSLPSHVRATCSTSRTA